VRGYPLGVALLLQAGIIGLAVLLALLFGLRPWQHLDWSSSVLGWSLLATVPLVAMLLVLPRLRWHWVEDITRLIERLLIPLFTRAPTGSVLLVAILAGVGEEMLFRGVIQDGLSAPLGTFWALVLASLLFGLAHAVTPGYFALASLMGVYLGWLYLASGNLLVPIIVHALYDWIAIHYYLRRRKSAAPAPHGGEPPGD
jgi:uncharacterized protein